jgi:pimeloyl-ACP methyl ester carboxylesterase
MPFFRHEGRRLAYTIYGDGPRTCVLVHGLLLSQKMHAPLAKALAERGNRVVTLDLLGHGRSDRPRDMTQYSMTFFGEQMIALLDHLEVEEAVLAGTSLGANATLEAAVAAPERVRGMVVEMPVLDNALLGCAIAFTPLMIALTFGEPVMRLVARGARLVPTGAGPWLADVGLDTIRQDPAPSAAVLHGLFFGRTAPHKALRRTIEAPALVIGHQRDPVHPFSDSGALVEELPDARLVEASSILELRLSPERLTGEIADFLDHCWKSRRRRGSASRARRVA